MSTYLPAFSNPHAAKEALKQRRARKQEAIDEECKKTLEDSRSFSSLEEKQVSDAPEAEAEKESDNGVPVPTPPVIPEPKDTEKDVPVPSPPEVPEPKESEEQVPVSAPAQVVKEEKVEFAGPGVPQEHQESGEDSPAAPVDQEENEEVGERRRTRKCLHVSRKIRKRQPGRLQHHLKEEPPPHD